MRIYKYPLRITAEQTITMPAPGRILSIGVEDDIKFVLWAEVNPDESSVITHTILGFVTGEELTNVPKRFIGTVRIISHNFVMHYFEKECDKLSLQVK